MNKVTKKQAEKFNKMHKAIELAKRLCEELANENNSFAYSSNFNALSNRLFYAENLSETYLKEAENEQPI